MKKENDFYKQTKRDFFVSLVVYPFSSIPYTFGFGIIALLCSIFCPKQMNALFEKLGFLLYVYIYLGLGFLVFLISVIQLIRSKSPLANSDREEHIVPLSYILFCFNAKYNKSDNDYDYGSTTTKDLVDALNRQNELIEEANKLQDEANDLLRK